MAEDSKKNLEAAANSGREEPVSAHADIKGA